MKRSPYFLWQTDSAPAKLGFAESDCVLVLEGTAKAYTVTEPDDAAARTAAGQFAEHIYKMTGCRLPDSPFEGGTPVYIGRAAELDLPDTEGFALAVGKDAVYAAGNDNDPFTGTAFAVTAMLLIMLRMLRQPAQL